MPDKKDRDAWWLFLSGAPASEWDPPRQPKGKKKQKHGRDEMGSEDLVWITAAHASNDTDMADMASVDAEEMYGLDETAACPCLPPSTAVRLRSQR